ncbi:MAG: crossover junction endodeoxyribonuclease RuvC [Kiritimatiellae bacterium]|nr:crossover junction endodeoxyribonuclease RuvC [Kiritimatiellia bacterium]
MSSSPDFTVKTLGIDTSLRSTGVAVVSAEGNRLSAMEYGVIKNAPKVRLSECLRNLDSGISEIIARTNPTAAAIEGSFFGKNVKTSMILGQVRGVAIAACARNNVSVYEYAPRRVKQAVVGFGSASKAQVRGMVMNLLGIEKEPQEDEGDALAIAICHLHNMSGHAMLAPKEI